MKVYHFINEKFGLQAIEKQRLKASTLDDLNDPFELFSIDMSSSLEFREALRVYRSGLAYKTYIICTSKSWKSPLLWSHYADRHKGMALEFEVPNEMLHHIKYQKSRIKIDEARIKNGVTTQIRLLTTKYKEWEYEDEARMFVHSEEIKFEGNLPFYYFNQNLKLTSVILGSLSELTSSAIKSRMPGGNKVALVRSRMAFKEFHIVRNKKIKTVNLKCA